MPIVVQFPTKLGLRPIWPRKGESNGSVLGGREREENGETRVGRPSFSDLVELLIDCNGAKPSHRPSTISAKMIAITDVLFSN